MTNWRATCCRPATKRRTVPGSCRCGDEYQDLLKSNFARPRQHRWTRRRQHLGSVLSLALCQEIRLGAPRHRRNGVEIGRRQRRDRPPGGTARALSDRARREAQVTQIFFYHSAADRIAAAAALIGKAPRCRKNRCWSMRPTPRSPASSTASCGCNRQPDSCRTCATPRRWPAKPRR